MKSLLVLSLLLLLVSMGTRAGVTCENKEILVGEDKILRYQDCDKGHSFYNFTILSSDIGKYRCEKVSLEPLVVECLYEVCTKGEGFFSGTNCEGIREKDLLIEF